MAKTPDRDETEAVPNDRGLQPITDAQYEWLRGNVLASFESKLTGISSRQAAEKLAQILGHAATMCAHRWIVVNHPAARPANRPRNVNMRQWFGSLGTFWDIHVKFPGVSSDGEHYGGPFVRFAQPMSKKLLETLRSEIGLRDAPFTRTLAQVCRNPGKVRMWLREIGITQLGSNFERYLTNRPYTVRGLPGWQFEIDTPKEHCYEIAAIDPKGKLRFKEHGLSFAPAKARATAKARRIQRK